MGRLQRVGILVAVMVACLWSVSVWVSCGYEGARYSVTLGSGCLYVTRTAQTGSAQGIALWERWLEERATFRLAYNSCDDAISQRVGLILPTWRSRTERVDAQQMGVAIRITEHVTWSCIPLWLGVLLAAGPMGLVWWFGGAVPAGHCGHCGYNLGLRDSHPL